MAAHEPRLGEVTLGKAPRALAVAHGVGPESEEVNTKLFVGAPCRVRADHLIGIILVGLIAVRWQVAGLGKEVTQAIVFTVHNIPRISGARVTLSGCGESASKGGVAAMEQREDCGGEPALSLDRPSPHG